MIAPALLLALSTIPAIPAPDDAVRAEVARLLHDAQSRSSLLLAPVASGRDGGFTIVDDNDAFRLNVAGRIQTRWLAAWRDDAGGVDPFTSGFQMRRVKFTFSGHVVDKSLRFKITNDFSRSSGRGRLSSASITKRFDNGLAIRAGQFLLPLTRESLDSSKRQLAVDRSLVNGAFGLDRSQGVQLRIRGDRWRSWAAFSDGADNSNTDFGSSTPDWALTGRFEWVPTGANKWFRTQAGAFDAEQSLRIGAAAHAEDRAGAGGRLVSWTGDVASVGPGWTALATIVGRDLQKQSGDDFTDWGVTAQVGIWANDRVLPFVRWELLIPDTDRAGDSKTNVLTAGANWYLHGDALKVTVDGVWLIDGAGDNDLLNPSTGTGVLDPGAGDSEFVLRVQIQALF